MRSKEVPVLPVSALINTDLAKPQNPTQSWEIWLAQKCQLFDNWTRREESGDWSVPPPNMPGEFHAIHEAITSEYWIPGIRKENLSIGGLMGRNSNGVFYRPGLGATGVMDAILKKIGNFRVMVVTDPVYKEDVMLDWSKGVLPINYYTQIVTAMGGENLEVELRDDQHKQGLFVSKNQLPSVKIPEKGAAVLGFNLNGVELSIALLPSDATKFTLDRYGILALGQPTPYVHKDEKSTVKDPRYSDSFAINAVKYLEVGGIIDYSKRSFGFIPMTLAPSVLGLKVVEDHDGSLLVQKTADYPERLDQAWKISHKMREVLGVLAGTNPKFSYIGYDHVSEQSESEYLQSVLASYCTRLNDIRRFITTLPEETTKDLVQRFEFILMGPIATEGQLDVDKIMKIHLAPDNPDEPSAENHYGPYFGRPGSLIVAHNNGLIDIFEYYQQIVTQFNKRFAQFRNN